MAQDGADLFDKVPNVHGFEGRKLQAKKVNNIDGKALSTIDAEPTADHAHKHATLRRHVASVTPIRVREERKAEDGMLHVLRPSQ